MVMRKSWLAMVLGAMECTIHSKPLACTSNCVPKGRLSESPLARWYTSERCAREKGMASVSFSIKYWRISGRMNSSKKRKCAITG